MKKNIIFALMLGGLFACNSQQFEKKTVQKPALITEKTASLSESDIMKAKEDFLSDVGFKEQFMFNATGKTWKDVDSFYKQSLQKYATAPYLDYLKGALVAALAGEPNENLKLSHDGTTATQEAIAFYASEIKGLKVKQSLLVLHFLQELKKFWTPDEVKTYAQQAQLWYVEDYPFWTTERDKLKSSTNLGIGEKGVLETLNKLLGAVEQIRTMAN